MTDQRCFSTPQRTQAPGTAAGIDTRQNTAETTSRTFSLGSSRPAQVPSLRLMCVTLALSGSVDGSTA